MGGPRLTGVFVGLALLGLVFAMLEARFRSTEKPPWYRRADFRTDLGYWFFTPLASGTLTRVAVGLALFAVVCLGGGSIEPRTSSETARLRSFDSPAFALVSLS